MKPLSHLLRSAGGLLLVLALTVAATAKEWSAGDKAEFQRIISSQISAFKRDDAAKAYSFASPSIKARFTSSSMFMSMVKTGYPAVYRAQSFSFEGLSSELGDPTQRVKLIGPEGATWLALYGFQRQPDGSWRISAVVIAKAPGAAA
ncbi:MAG: DUF4864 domain-containing protein [Pseudomonadota bacterium]